MSHQQGQTLIETLVACFILVMGITAALGLANYSLGATTSIKQQTIALGLAREGLEVVKNIRDTNWLKSDISSSCHDFLSGSNTAFCYLDWLNPSNGEGQDISAGSGDKHFALRFDPAKTNPWVLAPTETDFGLNRVDTSSGTGSRTNQVFYLAEDGLLVSEGTSGFGRTITISETSSFPPFDENTGPRLLVTSTVWWKGKNCPDSDTPPSDLRCSVVLKTYLTNWRNF